MSSTRSRIRWIVRALALGGACLPDVERAEAQIPPLSLCQRMTGDSPTLTLAPGGSVLAKGVGDFDGAATWDKTPCRRYVADIVTGPYRASDPPLIHSVKLTTSRIIVLHPETPEKCRSYAHLTQVYRKASGETAFTLLNEKVIPGEWFYSGGDKKHLSHCKPPPPYTGTFTVPGGPTTYRVVTAVFYYHNWRPVQLQATHQSIVWPTLTGSR
jgi:hypothetical protein